MTTERIVNITWNPDKDGHVKPTSILRVYNTEHELGLTKPSKFNTSVVAEASPLACPTFNGDVVTAQFIETDHIIQ